MYSDKNIDFIAPVTAVSVGVSQVNSRTYRVKISSVGNQVNFDSETMEATAENMKTVATLLLES